MQWKEVRWRDWVFIRNALLTAGYDVPKLRTLINSGHARKVGWGQYEFKCNLRDETPRRRTDNKSAIVRRLLTRRQGCVTADILRATGWPSVTVPGMARRLGLTLRTVRERGTRSGRVKRYYGTE